MAQIRDSFSSRTKVLVVLHNFHNRAGTEEHTKLLAAELADRYEIAFLFPQQGSIILRLQDSGQEQILPASPVAWPLTPKDDPVMRSSVKQALEIFSPQLIHIQHAH